MNTHSHIPLAARLRPQRIADVVGQRHLLGEGRPLNQAVKLAQLHSMILWGPPGTGKTTLARLLAQAANATFQQISAVLAGVKDIRAVVARAKENPQHATVLFVDEVHRFNKAQQDAFLPFVEDGTLTFIGATTENPSFELNNALLSRTRVYVLKPLTSTDILTIIERALTDAVNGLGELSLDFPLDLRQKLVQFADGDARSALNMLEIIADFVDADAHGKHRVSEELLVNLLSGNLRRFDKGGDEFYEQISALHKSVRGSSPDAALYWFARMIDGGCDPRYIARRVVRMASEDIGNADPRALNLCLDAWQTYERLGSPEGELAIAQAVAYLACAPKSNAIYSAFNSAIKDAKSEGSLPVPMRLRNAPTTMMKQMGYGKDYRYAHDEPDAFAVGEQYFPEKMGERIYYQPVKRGLEIKISEKLAQLRAQNKKTRDMHE